MSAAGEDGATAFEQGRYVYCIVAVEGDADADFETEGVDGERAYLVAADGVGAVVHDCASAYDTDDMKQVTEWLLSHQRVIDEAGEAFGTPLPFRFDTIIKGSDEAVAEWLRESRDDLAGHLDDLAGCWEYRIVIAETDEPDADALAADDERLAELRERIEESGEGTAFLLEKQYDQRLAELRRARADDLGSELRERLDPLVREMRSLDHPNVPLPGAGSADDDADPVVRVSVLARGDDEEAIGDRLDEIAARPGIEVRFTGPWPPYSYVPEL